MREAQLYRLGLRPMVRASGWRGSQVTIEMVGEVPTREIRETVMRLVQAEAVAKNGDSAAWVL